SPTPRQSASLPPASSSQGQSSSSSSPGTPAPEVAPPTPKAAHRQSPASLKAAPAADRGSRPDVALPPPIDLPGPTQATSAAPVDEGSQRAGAPGHDVRVNVRQGGG